MKKPVKGPVLLVDPDDWYIVTKENGEIVEILKYGEDLTDKINNVREWKS